MKLRREPKSATRAYTSLDELLNLQHSVTALRQDDPALIHSQHAGPTRARLRGQGIEFEEVRPYIPGDDIRSIDWRLSARTGKPLTKIYTEEREQPAYLVVDQRSQMFFGSSTAFKSVSAAQLAAELCWTAHKQNERLGGLVLSEQLHSVKTQHSQQSIIKLLNIIAEANTRLSAVSRAGVSLTDTLIKCRKTVPAGTQITVISDFHDFNDLCAATLLALSKRRRLQLIKISDSLEDTMSVSGTVGISNGLSTKSVHLSENARLHYLEKRARQHGSLLDCASHCKTQLLCLSEPTTSEKSMLEALRHGIA